MPVLAIFAFLARRRSLFFGGAIGSLIALFMPGPGVGCTLYRSEEAAFMGVINDYVHNVLVWLLPCATAGAFLGMALASHNWFRNRKALPPSNPEDSGPG